MRTPFSRSNDVSSRLYFSAALNACLPTRCGFMAPNHSAQVIRLKFTSRARLARFPRRLESVGLRTRKACIQLGPATKSGRGWPSWAATRRTTCDILDHDKPTPASATCSRISTSCASTIAGSAVGAPGRLDTVVAPDFKRCSAPMLRPVRSRTTRMLTPWPNRPRALWRSTAVFSNFAALHVCGGGEGAKSLTRALRQALGGGAEKIGGKGVDGGHDARAGQIHLRLGHGDEKNAFGDLKVFHFAPVPN